MLVLVKKFKVFAKNYCQNWDRPFRKKLALLTQSKAKLCKITHWFLRKPKPQKNVIITSTPATPGPQLTDIFSRNLKAFCSGFPAKDEDLSLVRANQLKACHEERRFAAPGRTELGPI
jgi:hypothetical protein